MTFERHILLPKMFIHKGNQCLPPFVYIMHESFGFVLGFFFSGLVSFSSSELVAQHPVWDETLPFRSGLHGTRPLLLAVATGPRCQSTLGQEPELQIPLEGIATGV